MLTREQNELLTRVGPGSPAGELLRRYWFPVAVTQDLAEQTTKFVRLLGEDLVLFKDKSGRVGLLADHCSHRGASLLYGRVEERGISCAYHGWLYDCEGNILETPPERNDAIMNSVKHTAYPVKQFIGMYWAYLGPAPAPVIPNLDVWVRKDGKRHLTVHPRIDASWVQAQENSLDPAHALILHQDAINRKFRPVDSTRGFIDDVESFEFEATYYGIMKKDLFRNGYVEAHPVMFPNVVRVHNSTEIRVPIDDTHAVIFEVYFDRNEDGSINEDDELELPVHFPGPYKEPVDALHPFARIKMEQVAQQDQGMWETQGPVVNRPAEHLSYSDRGVVMFRNQMFENIERVRRGEDPLAVFRDPDHPMIDTNLDHAISHRKPLGINTQTYEVAGTKNSSEVWVNGMRVRG